MFFKKKIDIESEFPKEITIKDKLFKIEIVFLKKRSSSVIIKGKTLIFRMSEYLSNRQAHKHFRDLLLRISKKIERSNNLTEEKNIEEVLDRGYFEFAQENYYVERTKNKGVKLKGNTFFINYHTKPGLIEKHIINLFVKRYSKRLESYVRELNKETYNFNINGFELKNLHSKWGHCTHDDVIMLNLKLLNAKKEVLDYVIFHELSHIKHKNHSKEFWNEVAKHCFNYKNYRKLLKDNPPVLFK